MISLEEGVELVWHALEDMYGGEVYVKKIPSMKVTDIARVIAPKVKHEIIGIRPGEKIHEQMISVDDADCTLENDDYFIIVPHKDNFGLNAVYQGKNVDKGFSYSSDINDSWMQKESLSEWINKNKDKIGHF